MQSTEEEHFGEFDIFVCKRELSIIILKIVFNPYFFIKITNIRV